MTLKEAHEQHPQDALAEYDARLQAEYAQFLVNIEAQYEEFQVRLMAQARTQPHFLSAFTVVKTATTEPEQ